MRYIFWRLVCGLCLAAVLPALATGGPVNSQKDAIKVAQSFMRQVGWTPPVPTPTVEARKYSYNMDIWRVDYTLRDKTGHCIDALFLEIERSTGTVVSTNYLATWRRLPPTGTPAVITKAQADAAFDKYLTIAGISRAQFQVMHDNLQNLAVNTDWVITYIRKFKGYEFNTDIIFVTLNPADASLLNISLGSRSPLPKAANQKLKSPDAEVIATRYLTAHNASFNDISLRRLCFVQPNGDYDHWATNTYTAAESRLAWVFRFGSNIEVWVDAETGAVIGGQKPPEPKKTR